MIEDDDCGPALTRTQYLCFSVRCQSPDERYELNQSYALKPGSPGAVAAGCRCPADFNTQGHGHPKHRGLFVVWKKCPVHGKR